MAQKRSVDGSLAQLRAIEAASQWTDDDIPEIRGLLSAGPAPVIAKAASVAGKRRISVLAEDLVGAFNSLIEQGAKADKGCLAKLAIIEALNALDYSGREVFLRGINYTQKEPTYGGRSDTAARLRAECAIGLVRVRYPQVHYELVSLLVDPEPEARDGAIRALAYQGSDKSELLLRMKALVGDKSETLVGRCLLALMRMNPAQSLDFVARFLDSDDPAIVQEAALVLAESRHDQAFEILRNCWSKNPTREFRLMLLVPMALTRREEACEFLCEVITHGPEETAIAAVSAAANLRDSTLWRTRVEAAVSARGAAPLTREYATRFGTR